MTKRLLLVILIAVGAVFVPYWVGIKTGLRFFAGEEGVRWYWAEGAMKIILTTGTCLILWRVYCFLILVIDYIRYGSFLVVLLCCLMGCYSDFDCQKYIVPEGFKLVEFSGGEYGISQGSDILSSRWARYGRQFVEHDGAKYTDSCDAKENLKLYLDDVKSNEFKPINK